MLLCLTAPGPGQAHPARVVAHLPRIAEAIGEHVAAELEPGERRTELASEPLRAHDLIERVTKKTY